MSINLIYNYAKVNVRTRRCSGVLTSDHEEESDNFYEYILLDHYDTSYMGKYYIDGLWYEDSAGTIPWSPEE